MAPELVQCKMKYNEKVDIWSFGIFAFELSESQPPYSTETEEKTLYFITKKKPQKIKDRFSKSFKDFVSKCLTKDPQLRPTVKALLKHKFIK